MSGMGEVNLSLVMVINIFSSMASKITAKSECV